MLLTSGIDLIAMMPIASEAIRRLIPAFSLSMIRVDARCAPQEHYSEFFDEFSHELFASSGHHFSARSDDPAAFGTLLRNPLPYGNLIHTPDAYLKGATYEHLFKRNGIHHCLDVALREEGRPLGILGIFREQGARPFTRSDVLVVREIYALLVHACAAEPIPASYDEIDSAMIVASKAGRIIWASPAARGWLEDCSPGQDRIALRDRGQLPEACAALCRAVHYDLRTQPRRSDVRLTVPTVTLPVPGGRLRLRAYPLEQTVEETSPSHVGIQLRLELHRGLRRLRALEDAPLSPQLRRLALELWRGRAGAEVAATLGISKHSL